MTRTMRDKDRSKEQLIGELEEMRRRVTELQAADTERKRAEEAITQLLKKIERAKQEWESTADSLPDLVCLVDDRGCIIRANRTVETWTLGRVGDVNGRGVHELLHPGCANLSCYLDSFWKQAWEKATRGQPAQCEAYDDILKRHLLIQVQPWKDWGKGAAMGSTVLVVRDVTDRKQMEELMRRRERLAAVGQLAAGIAHDFNNRLTSIMGFAELLHMRADVPESAKADLTHIIEAGHGAVHLIRQILDFSRKSLISRQPLDLAPFLKQAVGFLQRTIPESIHIVLETGRDEYLVNADARQLQQALINLAVNSRDAMPGGGELRLLLSRLTLKPADRRPFPGMEPGEWITLSVCDTGVGIPPEVLPHLYEPFFTTKPGEGTGLGLAQVYGIVKQHEGFIDVETEVGKGTTFIIYLPPLAVWKEVPREEAPEEAPRGQGETILVVEDEPQVLETCKAMLEHLGYRVLTALNGAQALDLYDQQRREISLVLVDMVMPQMGSVELVQALKGRAPEVRVVVMTGYPLGVEDVESLPQGIADLVQKPLDLVQLGRVVSAALK